MVSISTTTGLNMGPHYVSGGGSREPEVSVIATRRRVGSEEKGGPLLLRASCIGMKDSCPWGNSNSVGEGHGLQSCLSEEHSIVAGQPCSLL